MSNVFNFRCKHCNTRFGVRATRRPTAPMCPECSSNDTETLGRVVADQPRRDDGTTIPILPDLPKPSGAPHNKPHSQWLAVVDKLTRQWAHACADDAGNISDADLYELNTEREALGLPSLLRREI